jgi:NADH-quinone oxidoreductase subunit M
MLRAYQNTMLGEANTLTATIKDLNSNERLILIAIVVLVVTMGIYPKPLLDVAEPAVKALISMPK